MKIEENTISDYIEALSGKAAIPGGGGASALAGVYGVALGLMVGNLTQGKKKYAEFEPRLVYCMEKLEKLKGQFYQLSQADEEVFLPLSKAYGLPKETEEEKAEKERVLEGCLEKACEPPIQVMERTLEALNYMQELAEHGSRLAVSDVGVGVQYLNTAISGAIMNVYGNAKLMKNRARAEELVTYAETLQRDGESKVYSIYEQVRKTLQA